MSASATARLVIQVNTECPCCGHLFDVVAKEARDSDYVVLGLITENKPGQWRILETDYYETACPKCKTEFTLSEVQW